MMLIKPLAVCLFIQTLHLKYKLLAQNRSQEFSIFLLLCGHYRNWTTITAGKKTKTIILYIWKFQFFSLHENVCSAKTMTIIHRVENRFPNNSDNVCIFGSHLHLHDYLLWEHNISFVLHFQPCNRSFHTVTGKKCYRILAARYIDYILAVLYKYKYINTFAAFCLIFLVQNNNRL